jgi:hypothetical protein
MAAFDSAIRAELTEATPRDEHLNIRKAISRCSVGRAGRQVTAPMAPLAKNKDRPHDTLTRPRALCQAMAMHKARTMRTDYELNKPDILIRVWTQNLTRHNAPTIETAARKFRASLS